MRIDAFGRAVKARAFRPRAADLGTGTTVNLFRTRIDDRARSSTELASAMATSESPRSPFASATARQAQEAKFPTPTM